MFATRTHLSFVTARRRLRSATLAAALLVGATACSSAGDAESVDPVEAEATSAAIADDDSTVLWDSEVVHDIEVEFDEDAYDEMIATYETTQDKDWIEATVTIDGTTYDDVGLRLKGNSSLRGVTSTTAESPEDLPWLIRLDKFVDDQEHQGYTDIVIRSNSTETSINEAVAVELLAEAGLASQEAVSTTLSFNGGDSELRLAMQNPDGIWEDENFDSEASALYKAESTGDYSYRGDDPESYDEVFDQEAGEDDLEPLIDFLEFINNADDATFAAALSERLDVESFATYLAFQDLIDNFDDIDGRGNNSYLQYDYDTGVFTVVNWDLNLAFGTANVGGVGGGQVGGAGDVGGRQRPTGAVPGGDGGDVAVGAPQDGARPVGGGGAVGRGGGTSNILVERFMADAEFSALYGAAVDELTETLFTDGTAEQIVENWVQVLATQDIVDAATVTADADAVLQSISAT